MNITVLTLFPGLLRPFAKASLVGKAVERKKLAIRLVDFRKFAEDTRKTVDGYQAGGGAGMVIMAEPVVKAIEKHKTPSARVIMMTPQGALLTQKKVRELASSQNDLIVLCGHYEGFDERITDYVDEEISIGDYVTMGGEVAAAVLIEAVVRLIPGVINKASLHHESHDEYLLDYPVYTKPNVWRNKKIPSVLLEGNHKLIEEFRLSERIKRTKQKRPDLYAAYLRSRRDKNDKD